jgi:hypothetical protein
LKGAGADPAILAGASRINLADEGESQLLEIVASLRVGALNQTAKLLSQPFDLLFARFRR